MLEYSILSNKANVNLVKDGEAIQCKDLLSRTFNGDLQTIGEPIIINEYYVARPDLVSLAVYGDDKFADILCKLNGISNPFELNENMVIYCPTVDFLARLVASSQNAPSALVVKNAEYRNDGVDSNGNSTSSLNNLTGIANGKYSDGSSASNTTIDADKNNLQKLKSDRRTPGDQTVTDKNYIIDKSLGIVIY